MEKQGEVADDMRMDEKKLDATLAEAAAQAKKQNYVRANTLLQQAQKMATGGLHKILNSKTIVYDLKFDSPADEYEYELKRFAGYEELIPVAIEAKNPTPGAIKLMESFLGKARSRRDEAAAKAKEGDYPTAIAMLLQATKTVRRALRMVGVSQ
jgi:cellobiose-specific phosphotransferase system component IIA